jgi:hypothetical protein
MRAMSSRHLVCAFTRCQQQNRSATTAAAVATTRPWEDIPSLPRGLPIVGNATLLGKPYGIERFSKNLALLLKKYDPDNIGLLRFNSAVMNSTKGGKGRIIMISKPEYIEV